VIGPPASPAQVCALAQDAAQPHSHPPVDFRKGPSVDHLPPFTPRSRASSMRAVHTSGSTQAHRPRMSPPCLVASGTSGGRPSLVVSVTPPPPCLPLLHARYGASSLLCRL
jgi:hypothetical protein